MVFDLTSTNAKAMATCVRQGGLIALSGGVSETRQVRRMWMRIDVYEEMYGKGSANPTHWAARDVQAFVRRYVQGLNMVIVQKDTALSTLPDFKPTLGGGLTIFEVRFSLEPHEPSQFRLFGRFIETDAFIITSFGEKGTDPTGKTITFRVSDHRSRCQGYFRQLGFSNLIPTIEKSLTNVRISE